ncbi:hypothetical protein [Metabacillus idriensis]|uniref:hypothetical protein n=1 Tax=Metabacillus idriensis TaxID=324768 RepID=UPI001748C2C7|nr:hypothetical protein [Metabacillus idriensis]
MRRVTLKLLVEHIEFDSEEQAKELEEIQTYDFWSKVERKDVEELFSRILQLKGDWAASKILENEHNFIVDILLLNPYSEGKKEKVETSEILTLIDNFVKVHQELLEATLEDVEEFDVNSSGTLYVIEKEAESKERFFDKLNKTDLVYEIISKSSNRTEAGAGAEIFQVIVFVQESIASGIVYDVIKEAATSLPMLVGLSNLTIRNINGIKYKKLIKEISERTKLNPKDLIQESMVTTSEENSNKKEHLFVFRANGGTITVICNEKYEITDFEYKNPAFTN